MIYQKANWNLQVDQGRKNQALSDYNKAIEINPQHADAYNKRGFLLYNLGRNEEALSDYNKAIEINPQDADAYNNRGILLEKLGKNDEAIYDYNKSIQINLSKDQQKNLQKETQLIDQPLRNDNKEQDNHELQQILKRLNDLERKNEIMEKKKIDDLKLDENRYNYYQSLYWRLQNYISACQQLQKDQFQRNNEAVIDNNDERVAGQMDTVIKIIHSALEYAFSSNFYQITLMVSQIVQVRCESINEISEELKLAVLKLAKKLPEISQEQKVKEEDFLEYVNKISEIDRQIFQQFGVKDSQDPYWQQGIIDTLKILKNLLLNYESIQLDNKKQLHLVILESQDLNKIAIVKPAGRLSWCTRCTNSCIIQ